MTRKVLGKGFVSLLGILGKNIVRDKSSIIFQFEIKCPLFVSRVLNSYKQGAFVKDLKEEFYIPSFYFKQNGTPFTEQENNELYSKFENFNNWCYNFYKKLLTKNLSKKQASIIQPQNIYVQFYWTIDLKTLLYFLKQHFHDTYEIKQYSSVILDFLKENLPDMSELFKNVEPN